MRCINFVEHEVLRALREGGGQIRRPVVWSCCDTYYSQSDVQYREALLASLQGSIWLASCYCEKPCDKHRRSWLLGDEELHPNLLPGDRLCVREAWAETDDCQAWDMPEALAAHDPTIVYRADNDSLGGAWKSPAIMPAWASRLTIELTAARAERVHSAPVALTSFSAWWDSRYGKRFPWASNPWAWVYDYKVVA